MTKTDERHPLPTTPGRALRVLREGGDKTMGDLARFLGCSVVEISAIETENFDPLNEDAPTKDGMTLHGPTTVPVRWIYNNRKRTVSRDDHGVYAFLSMETDDPAIYIGFGEDHVHTSWADFSDLDGMTDAKAQAWVPHVERLLADLKELAGERRVPSKAEWLALISHERDNRPDLVERFLLTTDHVTALGLLKITVTDCLNENYDTEQEPVVLAMFDDWNQALGWHEFGGPLSEDES